MNCLFALEKSFKRVRAFLSLFALIICFLLTKAPPTQAQSCSFKNAKCGLFSSNPRGGGGFGSPIEAVTLSTLACQAKLLSKECEALFAQYPFLKGETNTCQGDDLCRFSDYVHQLDQRQTFAKLGVPCEEGVLQVIEELQKSFSADFMPTFKRSWSVLRDCIVSSAECPHPDLRQILSQVPENFAKELRGLVAEFESLECLSQSGKVKLLCYEASQGASSYGQALIPGRLLYKMEKHILGSLPKPPLPPRKGLEKLEERLGKKVSIDADYRSGSRNRPLFKMKDPESQKEIGSLSVIYDPQTNNLKIGTMKTEKDFRQMGAGEALMEKAITQFPDLKSISVDVLEETNLEVLKKAQQGGRSLDEAIKETPAYKIRRNLGYDEIVPGSIDPETYGFKVRKSENNPPPSP